MSEVASAPSAVADQAPAPTEAAPVEAKAGAAEPQQGKKKYKIDGREVSLDSTALKSIAEGLGISEEQFVRDYGTSANATRKAQEVAKLRQEVETQAAQIRKLLDGLKGDPEKVWELAKDFGHDPEKLAEEKLWKKIQYEKLSPEAKEALAAKQRADELERQIKDRDAKEKEAQAKAAAAAAEEEIQNDVIKVLELAKRKAEPGLIRRVAEIYESYMLAKKTKPSHEYVVQKLRDMRRQEFEEDLSGTDIEELMNTLPEGFTSRLQDHLVKKARSRELPSHQPSQQTPSTPKAKPARISIDEFFKNL